MWPVIHYFSSSIQNTTYNIIYKNHLLSHVYKKVNKLHENAIMCNILCYHTMLSYQTTSFALLRIAPAQHYHVCFVFKFCNSASSSISNMFVPMMMSMQSNNFRWHHQKESYSSYYHLTPCKNGIIEHFLGLKRSQNGAQEASAPVNLARPWSNDECREGVWMKGRHVVKLSLVPREKLNLHAFCSHKHRVKTKSIVKSCSGTWSTPICGEYFLFVASTVP